jgi:undecaprenyl diphosphate synthase
VPPVDLIIRTSGEQRLSNFMLWRAAYSELYFTATPWPAFTVDDLDAALSEYGQRQRRYGK